MSERRSGERHLLAPPGMGTLRVVQDVEVTHLSAHQAVVIAQQTIPAGERLLLEIPDGGSARSRAWLVRAVSSRALIGDGTLQRETHLSITRDPGEASQAIDAESSSVLESGPIVGALVRRVPIRLVQVSTSGCMWESPSAVDEGIVGFVDVRTSATSHTEAVRIVRTWRAVEQTWPYRMAVEFLAVVPPSPESLRGVAALMAVGNPSRRVP